MSEIVNGDGGWTPAVKLDLYAATTHMFAEVEDQFRKWADGKETPLLDAQTGWTEITPQCAEAWLIRNVKNRKAHFATIEAYAVQMINRQWKQTGQPILFSNTGDLLDGQHRLWAGYLSGCSFNSFVVSDVPYDDRLFAFIDNVLPRTAADALQTAGVNGQSPQVARIIKDLAWPYDREMLMINGRMPMVAMAHHEVLGYQQDNPELLTAVKLVRTNYKAAATRLGATVAGFVAWKILDYYGEDKLTMFMGALGSDASRLPKGHPVAALQKRLGDHEAAKAARAYAKVGKLTKKMIEQQRQYLNITEMLALTIIAFNTMMKGEELSKLAVANNEAFPVFVEPDELSAPADEASEAEAA